MSTVTDNYRLSIQHSVNGFSFCVIDDLNGLVVSEYNDNEEILISNLKKRFKDISLLVDMGRYLLIPDEEFDYEKSISVFSKEIFVVPDNEEIVTSHIDERGLVILFSVQKQIIKLLKSSKIPYSVNPSIAVPLKYFDKFEGENKIFIRYYGTGIDIIIIKGQLLQYCNSFQVSDFNAAFYFLMLAIKESSIDSHSTPIYINGCISDDHIELLSNYFATIRFFRNHILAERSKEKELKWSYMTFKV